MDYRTLHSADELLDLGELPEFTVHLKPLTNHCRLELRLKLERAPAEEQREETPSQEEGQKGEEDSGGKAVHHEQPSDNSGSPANPWRL